GADATLPDARRATPPLRDPVGGSSSVDVLGGLLLGRCFRERGRLVADGLLELAHARAERAPDLRHALGAEEQERDQEQEREMCGTGQAGHACSSWIEMSVPVSPATATRRRRGAPSSQSVYSPAGTRSNTAA